MRAPLLLLVASLAPACAPPCPPAAPLPQLERRLESVPDSAMVGVLLAIEGELTPARRRQLERCGLRIGSVLDGIVTGEAPRGSLGRLAALDFVAYIEAPEALPVPPFPLRPSPQQ